jgi:hypothetical protein
MGAFMVVVQRPLVASFKLVTDLWGRLVIGFL